MQKSEPPTASETGSNAIACDVVVIGGGPAGSTVSALLAERGWHVVVLEQDRHPRFHIGESLLPMNLPLFERLGVLEQVREIGVVKPGIEICSHRQAAAQTFYFEEAAEGITPHAFQVRRSEFDHLLLRNSARAGASVHEGTSVGNVTFRPGAATLVEATDGAGRPLNWNCRFLVDASGRHAFLSSRLGLKRRSKRHNSAAVFGHFRNAARRSGRDEGNIGLYWFDHGWFWMIPLRDGVMSVGAVCWPEYLKTRRGSLEAFLWQTIRACPGVHERMQGAELIGQATATGNYSYHSTRSWGDGYLLVGDAYAFVDPVFSTGVYLAMNSAVMGADAVDACLRRGRTAAPQLRAYDRRLRRGLRALSWFIHRFTTPAIQNLFMHPRDEFGMRRAVISVLAGDVFRRNGTAFPIAVFKGAYYVTAARNWGRSRAFRKARKRNLRLDFSGESA